MTLIACSPNTNPQSKFVYGFGSVIKGQGLMIDKYKSYASYATKVKSKIAYQMITNCLRVVRLNIQRNNTLTHSVFQLEDLLMISHQSL